jgi:mono/diheme cytochrome c family protein
MVYAPKMKLTAKLRAGAIVIFVFSTCLSIRAAAAADSTGELKRTAAVPSSNPLSGDAQAIDQGNHLFLKWCAQCHGTNATGGKYGANLTIFSKGYKEFLATVKNGRVQKQMPPWKDVLDEESIKKIGAYLETLAQPDAYWK